MNEARGDQVAEHERLVDDHFRKFSSFWKDLYEEKSLYGLIHQQRRAVALSWIDGLSLPRDSRILEIGFGAGLLAVDLASRGFKVDGIDSNRAMVELAQRQTADVAVADRVSLKQGDAHAIEFSSGSFGLVVALGVVPFLHSPLAAIREMARVVEPGGFVLFSNDNRYRLNRVLDPKLSPSLRPARLALKAALQEAGLYPRRPAPNSVPVNYFSRRQVKQWLSSANMFALRWHTLGFGPFSMLGRPLFEEERAIRLHERLQALADRGTPLLRSCGSQHIVLACRE